MQPERRREKNRILIGRKTTTKSTRMMIKIKGPSTKNTSEDKYYDDGLNKNDLAASSTCIFQV